MKTSIKKILSFLPKPLKQFLGRLKGKIDKPFLRHAENHYRSSDYDEKLTHILEAINYLRVAGANGVLPQVYFEFGCHSGRTFCAAINAAQLFEINSFRFFAFDSFEGLPKTNVNDDGYFEEGTFSTTLPAFQAIVEKNTGYLISPNQVIKGFYQNTLTQQLQSSLPKVGVVHIDVDLYSSTVEVLAFIKPLLVRGSLLMFDDWYCFPPTGERGEMRAFREFQEENPDFQVMPWKAYSTFGQSFFVTKCLNE